MNNNNRFEQAYCKEMQALPDEQKQQLRG